MSTPFREIKWINLQTLSKPIYEAGRRYDYRARYYVRGSVPGLYREEIARAIGEAIKETEPVK
jgi:hypothetical protein